ncbi:Sodium/hydrogen exchanger family-domain-containing protein [Sparassis latifolia]
MRFHPFQTTTPHIAYAVLGGFVVIFGMLSLFIREKLYMGEALLAFLFGIIIGPYGANIFNPRGWGGGNPDTVNTIVLEFTRVVLAIGVFAIGVELPKQYMKRHWKSLFFLLCPVMTWGWFVSAGLIYALIPGLNFLSSLAVAACLTPTDPILAAAVIGGKYADKHVPAHLRHLLAAESGCNDGAAFPFLFIALYLTLDSTTGRAIEDWFLVLWLYQVMLGVVLGALIGFGFRHLMKFCERKDLIDRQSYVAQYVSLAILTIGVCTLLGSDDLLAAFSCGTAFAWDGFFNKQTEEAVFSSVIDLLFNIAAFVFVGAWMPFHQFSDPELTLTPWRLIVIAILVLLLRRLPIMVALYRWIPDMKTFREAVFSGHFGPIGVGAVFISTLAAQQLPKPASPPEGQAQLLAASIQPIVAFMVLCSVTIHGLSIPFFSLGRRVHSVSRTWSRHDTFGTFSISRSGPLLPEWTTQTRRIVPGEDVVINRDSDTERGILRSPEKENITPDSSADREGEGSRPPQREKHVHLEKKEESDTREYPPDGTETVAEWKEGPHNIVERRTGPGSEVEVEVQRDAFGPRESASDTLRDAGDAAQSTIQNARQRIRRVPNDLEHLFERAEEGLQEETHEMERTVATAENRLGMEGAHEEEDEGWMSDTSDRRPEVSTSTEGKEKSRSRSPKKPGKLPSLRPTLSTTRRRSSIRRGVLAIRTSRRLSGSDAASRPPEDSDGEPSPETAGEHHSRPEVRPGSASRPSSLRHARVDSLRSSESPRSREHSPTRSVRFAISPTPSGYNSPRITSPSSPVTPLPGSEAPSEDEREVVDSPRAQVRFNLPTAGEAS